MSENEKDEKWHPDPMTRLTDRVEHVEEKIKNFVTKDEFRPIRILVYGFVGIALVTLLGAMFSKVLIPAGH